MSSRISKLAELQTKLNYQYKNTELLETALTHKSAKKQNKGKDYEQLEFVGDAVLDLGIAHILLKHHPKKPEGELSKMRAALVNTESLADIAREIEVGDLIRFSDGERSSGGAEKSSILADVVEALFGAMYIESGFSRTFQVIDKVFSDRSLDVNPKDPKTELQEVLHVMGLGIPEYTLEDSSGPDHAPTFTVSVAIDGQVRGQGLGTSKKAAQQSAAQEALKKLRNE